MLDTYSLLDTNAHKFLSSCQTVKSFIENIHPNKSLKVNLRDYRIYTGSRKIENIINADGTLIRFLLIGFKLAAVFGCISFCQFFWIIVLLYFRQKNNSNLSCS